MKIMNNKKLNFLIFLFGALLCNLISSFKSKKSTTVFELYNSLNHKGGKARTLQPETETNSTAAAPSGTTEPQKAGAKLEEWFSISSSLFSDSHKHPSLILRNGTEIRIQTDEDDYRLNPQYSTDKKDENSPPSPISFWFRLNENYLYYGYTKTDVNLAGAILIETHHKINKQELFILYCIVIEHGKISHTICNDNEDIRNSWWIQISINLGIILPSNDPIKVLNPSKFEIFEVEEKIIQPIILIPMNRKSCNDQWNYDNFGKDWQCICSEGREQSPINLPNPKKVIETPITPEFHYKSVAIEGHSNSFDGLITADQLDIKYFKNAVRLLYPNFGQVFTMDGAVYQAEEILFHTPSEHTIAGKRYDMEMQILHYGRSVGDIAKQVVVSFLFKRTVGAFVKFFESFDLLNLPNQLLKTSKMISDIDINKLFYEIDDTTEIKQKPFSFFTYQGSLTFPPCTERTIHYVASKPIPLAEVIIDHFREATGKPQYTDTNYKFEDDNKNYRDIQPLNGRDIFHWDHEKYCGIDHPKVEEKTKGHYEKYSQQFFEYYYIKNEEPSGIPTSEIVSENEALKEKLNLN